MSRPMRSSSNLLEGPTRADGGKLHFGAALIHPLGVSMYSVRRVPAWPSTYSFPQGRMLANFFCLPFDGLLFALYDFTRSHTPWCGLLLLPFAVSHDLTHLGRKVREHIPLKKFLMPWAHGPANIIAYPSDFASRLPPGTLGTWIL